MFLRSLGTLSAAVKVVHIRVARMWVKCLWQTFDYMSKMCFAKQPKTCELRTCSKTLIPLSHFKSVLSNKCVSSTKWRPGLPAYACACMVANVNICGPYLCTPLSLKVYVRRSPAAAAAAALPCCVEAAGTRTAAWSLQRHRFLFKKPLRHLNSSDLTPVSTLWSHTQLAWEQVSHPFHWGLFFALKHKWKTSSRVCTQLLFKKRTKQSQKTCQITATVIVDDDTHCKQRLKLTCAWLSYAKIKSGTRHDFALFQSKGWPFRPL